MAAGVTVYLSLAGARVSSSRNGRALRGQTAHGESLPAQMAAGRTVKSASSGQSRVSSSPEEPGRAGGAARCREHMPAAIRRVLTSVLAAGREKCPPGLRGSRARDGVRASARAGDGFPVPAAWPWPVRQAQIMPRGLRTWELLGAPAQARTWTRIGTLARSRACLAS